MDNHDLIMEKLGKLEGKIDSVDDHLKRLNGSVSATIDRTRILEQWKDGWVGKLSIVAILIGAGITVIVNWIIKKINQ